MKLLVTTIFLIFAAQGALAMSVFNPIRTCVFSEVRARLTLNGEPIKNTKVIGQRLSIEENGKEIKVLAKLETRARQQSKARTFDKTHYARTRIKR